MILKYKGRHNSDQAVKALNILFDQPASTVYTEKLRDLVKDFQYKCGVKVDGIAGPNTLTCLAVQLPDVKYHDYSGSKYVRAAQALVDTNVDGKFGRNSAANVRAFQSTARLNVTGEVTRKVWLALWDCPYEIDAPDAPVCKVDPVDYKQYDRRWKYKPYTAVGDRSQTIGSSGCGPTSMADIMAAWIDKNITPVEMCEYALKHGYRTRNSGTAWGFFQSIAKTYKFRKFVQTRSMTTLRAALNDGALAVASMGPGYWTKGGHFICVYKMDGSYVYAKDPASSSRKRQRVTDFERQRKQFFIFYR